MLFRSTSLELVGCRMRRAPPNQITQGNWTYLREKPICELRAFWVWSEFERTFSWNGFDLEMTELASVRRVPQKRSSPACVPSELPWSMPTKSSSLQMPPEKPPSSVALEAERLTTNRNRVGSAEMVTKEVRVWVSVLVQSQMAQLVARGSRVASLHSGQLAGVTHHRLGLHTRRHSNLSPT